MFSAIARWIKAFGYLVTGQVDAARRTLDTNPHVVRAKYDEIIRAKLASIQQYKQAVAGLIAQEENKLSKVKSLTNEVEKLERLKAGALAKAKQTVEKMKSSGKSMEEIKQDENYLKCLTAYNDFSSTLEEKQGRITELETDVEDYAKRIGEHKTQLQSLMRDIENVRGEAHDAVADMITAKEEKDLADMISGIAKDGTSEELARMRQLRQEVKAEARISKELAGTNTAVQEAEFLDFASKSESSNEFDALIGLAESVESSTEKGEDSETISLPE